MIEPGSVWRGVDHDSRWMAFASERPGRFDLWCMDPGTSTYWERGSIATTSEAAIRSMMLPST